MEQDNRKNRKRPIWLVVLLDLLLTGLLLAVFGFFQIQLPVLRARTGAAPAPVPTPLVTPAPAAAEEALLPSATPDGRTPWQIRFADRFTPEIVRTETSYTSPEVSITVETHTRDLIRNRTAVYHLADVYLASIDCFRTYTANNELAYLSVQDAGEMDAASGALLSVGGDCYSYQQDGFLLRNGAVYMKEKPYEDICVLFRDGRLNTYSRQDYNVEDILQQEPWQIWSFGPSLLDEEGRRKDSYELTSAVSLTNPRCAIGCFEPGHYCFVVVDGRQPGYSDGMFIWELADLFEELGCPVAYNLDGGGSAVMYFNHERVSRPSNGERKIGDIVLIRERIPTAAQRKPGH